MTYQKATLALFLILLITLFAESGRVLRFMGPDRNILEKIATSYLKGAEHVKGFFGGSVTDIYPTSTTQTSSTTGNPTLPPFEAPEPPYHILMAGDSFVADIFGIISERTLETFADTSVTRRGVYSTGLSRPDYFDWNEELTKLLAEEHPNVAIVMFGANDGQDIISKDGAKRIIYGTPAWDEEYFNRARAFLDIFQKNNVMVFWVGNPIASSAKYAEKMERMNGIDRRAVAGMPNARYIETWDLLRGPDGLFARYLPNTEGKLRLARSSDGIHVTEFGAQFLLARMIETMKKELELLPAPPSTPSTE